MSEAVIHLRVPAEIKARWVAESRAAGMRLTDWIVGRVEMQSSKVFDVTLYWHDGGSVFLGTVASMSADAAEQKALERYTAQSKAQEQEIDEGGGYQTEAVLLLPDEAARWWAKELN